LVRVGRGDVSYAGRGALAGSPGNRGAPRRARRHQRPSFPRVTPRSATDRHGAPQRRRRLLRPAPARRGEGAEPAPDLPALRGGGPPRGAQLPLPASPKAAGLWHADRGGRESARQRDRRRLLGPRRGRPPLGSPRRSGRRRDEPARARGAALGRAGARICGVPAHGRTRWCCRFSTATRIAR
jgi:hypothetical protein